MVAQETFSGLSESAAGEVSVFRVCTAPSTVGSCSVTGAPRYCDNPNNHLCCRGLVKAGVWKRVIVGKGFL